MPPEEWNEAGKWTSAVQAFFLLTFFFAAVAFGANFRLPPDLEYVEVELYELPPPSPEPSPIKTPAPKPPPKPVAQTETPADIALEKQRKAEKKREEERARKKEEKRLAEEKERVAEQKRKEEEREHKEREEELLAAEKRKEERRLAEQQAAEEQRERETAEAQKAALERLTISYVGRIKSSIRPYLITPPEARGVANLEVVVEVRLEASGDLSGLPQIVESSGVPEYDNAAYRAVLKASPLPMPKEPELLKEFRHLTLRITPE